MTGRAIQRTGARLMGGAGLPKKNQRHPRRGAAEGVCGSPDPATGRVTNEVAADLEAPDSECKSELHSGK